MRKAERLFGNRPIGWMLSTAIRGVTLALAWVVSGWGIRPVLAQDPDDFSELGLEDLLATDMVPLNILGTHTHFAGEWMVGYQFMSMDMGGNRQGTNRLSDDDVLQDFMVAPTRMKMQMHMLEVMYAPSDRLTLMLMIPFWQKTMDHVTRSSVRTPTVFPMDASSRSVRAG